MSLWHRFPVLRLLLNLNERTLQMAATLDDIQSALAAQADKIAALEARVTAQATDPAKVQTLMDTVTANNAKIDAIAPAPTPPADTPPAPAQ